MKEVWGSLMGMKGVVKVRGSEGVNIKWIK